MMQLQVLFEACVDSPESAKAAELAGAGRIELCSALSEGGITPSAGLIKMVCAVIKIPVNILIRPRGGDFIYTDDEFEVMKNDIAAAKHFNINGIVTGVLTPEGDVDSERMRELIGLARPLEITFHRAFDMVRDPIKSLYILIGLGVDRILTSGQMASAVEGIDLIAEMTKNAGSEIIIMPGGGINKNNIRKIVEQTGVKEIHGSARVLFKSCAKFFDTGYSSNKNDFILKKATRESIKELVDLLN